MWVCLAPQLSLPVYLHADLGPSTPPPAASLQVLSAWLPSSAPPTGLDEGFFFISTTLVVGLPYSSIFCEFWLFFVFKLLFFWLCKEASVSADASLLAGSPLKYF